MNLRSALHKNPGLILTAIVTLAIVGVPMIDVAQTRIPDTPAPHLKESDLISAAREELAQGNSIRPLRGRRAPSQDSVFAKDADKAPLTGVRFFRQSR